MQPADMGMIAGLKVGYRLQMLKKLLAICDDEELYKDAIEAGQKARKGCIGLAHCGKAHLLDAAQILNQIWLVDGVSIHTYISHVLVALVVLCKVI
jgi:hypothetical protein